MDSSQADSGIVGAACPCAGYDPVSRRCAPPAPDTPCPRSSAPTAPSSSSTSALGLGGMPFAAADRIPRSQPGSSSPRRPGGGSGRAAGPRGLLGTVEPEPAEGGQPVLRTDGLIEDRHQDVDAGPEGLRTVPARADRAPEETCEAVRDTPLPACPSRRGLPGRAVVHRRTRRRRTGHQRHPSRRGPVRLRPPRDRAPDGTSSGPNCRCRKGATGHEHMSLRFMFGKGLVNENDYR